MTCRPVQFHLLNFSARRLSLILGASKLPGPHGRPDRYPGVYHARNLSGVPPLWREGGEYNTLRGNKPACLWSGFEPPASSAVVESRSGGAFNADHGAFTP